MADDGDLVCWAGKRVDDMTREEAIAALKQAGRIMRRQSKEHIATLETISRFHRARAA